MSQQIHSYFASGKIYLTDLTQPAGLRWTGLVDEMTTEADVEEKTLADRSTPGGGKADSVARINGITGKLKVRSLSAENIALALQGTVDAVTAGTVTDEAHTAYKGALIKLAAVPDLTLPIVVTNSAGSTTYAKDVDYELSPAGIVILEAGAITNAQAILVDYTRLAGDAVQVLTSTGRPYGLVFEGVNEPTGKAVVVEIFRIKFKPAGVNWLGDDFAALDLEFEALIDLTKTGNGISRYMKVQKAA